MGPRHVSSAVIVSFLVGRMLISGDNDAKHALEYMGCTARCLQTRKGSYLRHSCALLGLGGSRQHVVPTCSRRRVSKVTRTTSASDAVKGESLTVVLITCYAKLHKVSVVNVGLSSVS